MSWAAHFLRFMHMEAGDSCLDWGCAMGNYVRALRMLGIEAYGVDVSEYAVTNAEPEVRPFLSNHFNGAVYDYAFSKDTAEHVPPDELERVVAKVMSRTRKKALFIVPLAKETGGEYVHPKEENDTTHVNRWTMDDWLMFFQRCAPNFIVAGSYQIPGLKPGAYEVDRGYGFITLERI